MKRPLIALAALCCASAVLIGRQATPGGQALPVFRTGVQTVQIDVVVLDKDGKAVHGLTKDDFTIRDRKQAQRVSYFEEVSHPVDVSTDPDPPASVPRDVATNTTPRAGRLVVLVVDDTVPNDRMKQMMDITRQTANAFGEDASMSLLTISGTHQIEVTQDHASLLAEIDKLPLRSWQAPSVARTKSVETGVCAFPMFIHLAEMLRGDDTQRKAVVYVSPYCPGDLKEVVRTLDATGRGDAASDAVRMIEAFRKANVAFYAVDPRGPEDYSLGHFDAPDIMGPEGMRAWRTQCVLRMCDPVLLSQDNLHSVTEATGGFAITNTNEIQAGISRIVDDFGHYYLLGFDAGDPGDKSYRPLEVTVNRPGLTLRYRKGYQFGVAPLVSKNKDPMVAVSTGVLPRVDLPLHLLATPLPSAGKTTRVVVALKVGDLPTAPGLSLRDNLDITVLAANLGNSKVAGEFLRPRQVLLVPRSHGGVQDKLDYQIVTTVALPPGKYQLRVSAKSARLDRVGSVYDVVDVPDYAKTPLSIGALVIGYADPNHHPVSTTLIDADTLPFEPVLDRAFARTDGLRLFCEIWRRDPSKATTTRVELLDAQDQIVATMDRQQPAGKAGEPLARLDVTFGLGTLSRGAYQLRVTTTDGTNTDLRSIGMAVR